MGNIIGSVSVVRDITEDQEGGRPRFATAEDRMRFALETIHTGAWDLDIG